jgi:hypothetical protein
LEVSTLKLTEAFVDREYPADFDEKLAALVVAFDEAAL